MHIFVVDDSTIAANNLARQLQGQIPGAQCHVFASADLAIAKLSEDSPLVPDVVMSDWNMPGRSGLDLLKWLRNHPKYHLIPLAMVSAEQTEEDRRAAGEWGAAGYLTKPFTPEDLSKTIEQVKAKHAEMAHLREMESRFLETSQEIIDQSLALIQNLSEVQMADMQRLLHTLKGDARLLQYAGIGHFVHSIEDLLGAVKKANLYNVPTVIKIVQESLVFLEHQVDAIRANKPIMMPSEELKTSIKRIQEGVAMGWDGTNGPANLEKPRITVSKSHSSTRIPNDKLDAVQAAIKKIVTHKVKLSKFASDLGQEFYDEQFPKDLQQIVNDLNTDALGLMGFFIELRTVPVTRCHNYAHRLVNGLCQETGKPATLHFESEDLLEIDQQLAEILEQALGHLVRNSFVHGIESEQDRMASGKSETAKLSLRVKGFNQDHFDIWFSDDGKGIDLELLAERASSISPAIADFVKSLTTEKLVEVLFIDGLSTKDSADQTAGRGVGMSAVRSMIQGAGGELQVKTEIGRGTEFHIRLPKAMKI